MAENVTIKIKGQDETRGALNSARTNLDGFARGVQQAGTLIKAAIGAVVVREIINAWRDVTNEFAKSEQAEIRLVAAAKNNPYINGEALEGLRKYANQIQETTIFEDDLVVQQEALLVSYGRTEEQIENIIDASADLASAGIPGIEGLEQAVRVLSGTYSGVLGQTGRLLPELRNFTEEQLRHGAAIEYVQRQYAGMATAMTETLTGKRQQFANMIGDLKEAIGAALAPLEMSFMETLMPGIKNMTRWFEENEHIVANFGKALGDVVNFLLEVVKAIMTIVSFIGDIGPGVKQRAFERANEQVLEKYKPPSYFKIPEAIEYEKAAEPIVKANKESTDRIVGAVENVGTGETTAGTAAGTVAGGAVELPGPGYFETFFADMAASFMEQFSLAGIFDQLSAFGLNLSIVNRLMNPIHIILTAMFQILEPILNNLLIPIIGILTIFGNTIGVMLIPILKLLTPVLQIISAGFIILYNLAIVPFGNAVIFCFKIIHNMVAVIWNAIASAINFLLGWLGVHVKKMKIENLATGYLEAISSSTVTEAGAAAAEGTKAGTSISGGNVTAQRQPDIYIYQYYYGPIIGDGGMRQVGEYTVRAIEEYAAYGGKVTWMEEVA